MSYASAAPPWQAGGQPSAPQPNYGSNGSQPNIHPHHISQPDALSAAMSSMSIGAAPGSTVTYPPTNSYGPPAQYPSIPAPPQQQYSPSPVHNISHMNHSPPSGLPGPQNASIPVQTQQSNGYSQPPQQPANPPASSYTNNYANPPLGQYPNYSQNPQPTDTNNQQIASNTSTPGPSYQYSAPPTTTISPPPLSAGPPVSQVSTPTSYSSYPAAQSPPSYASNEQAATTPYGQYSQPTGNSKSNTAYQPAQASVYPPQNNGQQPLNQYPNQPQASRDAAPSYQGI
jgi:hypothetical protein